MSKDTEYIIVFKSTSEGEDNVPHEVINLFKPDNSDKSFLYIPNRGGVRKNISENVSYAIAVESLNADTYKIRYIYELSKDEDGKTRVLHDGGKQPIDNKSYNNLSEEDQKNSVMNKTDNNIKEIYKENNNSPVEYYGTELKDIHFKRGGNTDNSGYATFVVENVYVPDKDFYILGKEGKNNINDKNYKKRKGLDNIENNNFVIVSQDNISEIGYCTFGANKHSNDPDEEKREEKRKKAKEDFDELKAIINEYKKDEYINKLDTVKNSLEQNGGDIHKKALKNNMLKLMLKTDDETVFTNMLGSYLKVNDVLDLFVKDVLNIENFHLDEMPIKRELTTETKNGRLDLLITGKYNNEKSCIIIENKIKSGLNDVNEDGTSQLSKYVEDKQKGYVNIFVFLLMPVWSHVKVDPIEENILLNKIKELGYINYENVYSFFKDQGKNKFEKDSLQKNCYDQFLASLGTHAISIEQRNSLKFFEAVSK